ncbi:MAG: hypothetical protein ACJAZN_000312 [Planctomycetota bacterium]|jgi:hypothetical protein
MTLRFQALRLPSISLRAVSGSLLGALLLSLGGCDNPVCVFASNCFNGGGGEGSGDPGSLGGRSAIFPGAGAIMRGGAPELLAVAPGSATAGSAHPNTPLFLEFSESLNPATLIDLSAQTSAFRVINVTFQQDHPMGPPQLVGDDRVVVLLPLTPYMEGTTYQVLFADDQKIADINGQLILEPSTGVLLEIFVDSSSVADEPRLIYSYPSDGSINNPDTAEIVVGFDRQMDDSTIDSDSFAVTVAGVTPVFNPQPRALTTFVGMQQVPLTQVYTWTPQESGEVRPYGTNANVTVNLSDAPNQILSEAGDTLVPYETGFRTADFSLPSAVAKAAGARPANAFGRADVFGGAPIVDVTLDAAAPNGSQAEFFLFGRSPVDSTFVKSLIRTVDVPNGALNFSVTSDDLGLFDALGDVQFADGTVQVAVQVRSGNARSSARRFDADPSTSEIDAPIFDTTAPVLLGLGGSGAVTSQLVGEVRDFAAFGRASEPIAFAFVDAGVNGTNGGSLSDPPATAFSTSSPEADEALFMAAPIAVGAVDPSGAGISYVVTVYDEAFNAATLTAIGTFTQVGVVGPGGAPTGSIVDVRVFNALTLAPVNGALVFSHQESGGATSFVASASTIGGVASVAGAGAGSTVITVDAAGFDLFTFHGVPRDAVDILLKPTLAMDADIEGTVTGTLTTGLLTTDNVLQDTRAVNASRTTGLSSCGAINGFTAVECEFGPVLIQPGRLGGVSSVGTNNSLTLAEVSIGGASIFLLNFALAAPFAPVGEGDSFLGAALDAGGPLGIAPAATAAVALSATGVDLSSVPNFGALAGDPKVTIEAAGTGLAGPLLVGAGLSFDQGGSTYAIVSAVPGVASVGGELELSGAIDPERFIRIRALDAAMNEVVARPRASAVGLMTAPMGVPILQLPAPGGMSGGAAYNVVVADTLLDATGFTFGLYRAHLTDSTGRAWTLVGLDTSDGAGDILLSVPDIGAQGGTPLLAGQISVEVEAYAADLDRGEFLWTDLERQHELYSRAAPVTFTQN